MRLLQFLRPRWTSLYAARKKQKNAAAILPELPGTFFGWIPVLYRITEEEVLASAGLDAFVVRASQASRRVRLITSLVPILLQIRHQILGHHLLLCACGDMARQSCHWSR